MDSLLNTQRPPVFCPGCSHERVVRTLDRALVDMGRSGDQVVIVSDIGCSGLFDTFFNTHAFHGLHGRALTYATGIKMARPELTVIVTMGDGGLGIGGAHVLSTCRRNIDITLLVLNNFNYGMTGGQCSSTTPEDATVASGFLNRLEPPLDICQVAGAAGAPMLRRVSTYDNDLAEALKQAIAFEGFSLLDIWGLCPGRYTRANRITPKSIDADLALRPDVAHFKSQNARTEFGAAYRAQAASAPAAPAPAKVTPSCIPPQTGRQEIVILGSAGQRIVTAGELLCLAGAAAGLQASQKNDYPITVMRGHSVSEIILSQRPINFTGIEQPSVVMALAPEGIARRRALFSTLTAETTVLCAAGLDLPPTSANIITLDLKAQKIKPHDWALAALTVMAGHHRTISMDMLHIALRSRFGGDVRSAALEVVKRAARI